MTAPIVPEVVASESRGAAILRRFTELGLRIDPPAIGVNSATLTLVKPGAKSSWGETYDARICSTTFTGFPGCCGACTVHGLPNLVTGSTEEIVALWYESWQYCPYAHSILIAIEAPGWNPDAKEMFTRFGWEPSRSLMNYVHRSMLTTWIGHRKPHTELWPRQKGWPEPGGYAGR